MRSTKTTQRVLTGLITAVVAGSLSSCHVTTNTEPLPKETTIYAFGDSTMSLAEGHPDGDKDGTCFPDKDTWVDKLGGETTNLSCPGSTVEDAVSAARRSNIAEDSPHIVFITTGTNLMRRDVSIANTTQHIQNLIETIQELSPGSTIYLVGYLPIEETIPCSDNRKEDEKYAHYLNTLHNRADQALREAARRTEAEFINTRKLTKPICSEDTYIRLPGQDGVPWHTTQKGHEAIAHKVLSKIHTL